MSGWTIVVDRPGDVPDDGVVRNVLATRDYIAQRRPGRTRVLNLSRSYAYLGLGYYCSLLAEGRGDGVVPTVDTILELQQRSLYAEALPDLEEALNRRMGRLTEPPTASFRLLVMLGVPDDDRFPAFARQVFDRFRCPIVEVRVRHGPWRRIAGMRPVGLDELGPEQAAIFWRALDRYTRSRWRAPKARPVPRCTLAVLHDPKEPLPPSKTATLQRLARVAETMGVEVEPITRKDYLRLAEFDALFIRETTAIDHHTYRFAKRAEQEGMPVIDDPTSILRCTNKVYLADLMRANRIATPKTLVVDGLRNVERLEAEFAYPIVLKIPDGSFSRGVVRAQNRNELRESAHQLLADSDLILAQEYMYTEFDWRVGVLDGAPLFVCQYMMAKKHWQIVRHDAEGRAQEGRFRTFAVEDAPAAVVDAAVRAARLIGRGLYGVDLKQTPDGVYVIEVNDNPNLDHGVEDAVLKDELWRRLMRWFLARLD